MAKNRNQHAAQAAEPEQHTVAEEAQAHAAEPEQHDGGDAEPAGEFVKGLVLYDSVYGKCGEVRQFPAEQAQAIAAAGFIDIHQNAVRSAGG